MNLAGSGSKLSGCSGHYEVRKSYRKVKDGPGSQPRRLGMKGWNIKRPILGKNRGKLTSVKGIGRVED